MQQKYQVIIIGGGASGLISAISLTQKNIKNILVLEKMDRVGKKLASTGNGQGNITNSNILMENYHGDVKQIEDIILQNPTESCLKFYNDLGIYTVCEENKIYPMSKQANSVVDIFRAYLSQNKVDVLTKTEVLKVQKTKNGFVVKTNNNNFCCDYIIFACGGKVASQFGTDGSAYNILTENGHSVTKLYPSLVQLKTENKDIRLLDGIKVKAQVTLYNNEKQVKQTFGDLLFTKYGVSGSAIFYLSAYLTHNGNEKIVVDFMPDYTESQIIEMLNQKLKVLNLPNTEIFVGLINKKVGEAVVRRSENNIKSYARGVKQFEIILNGTLGYNYAQVTKGGIPLTEVNKNLESKILSNLYIVGEALNIDGDCGGYNLHFAYASAITAVNDILLKQNK